MEYHLSQEISKKMKESTIIFVLLGLVLLFVLVHFSAGREGYGGQTQDECLAVADRKNTECSMSASSLGLPDSYCYSEYVHDQQMCLNTIQRPVLGGREGFESVCGMQSQY